MITEAALPLLDTMVNLKSLDLSHTRVNQASVTRLRRKLDSCSVVYAPDPLLDALSQNRGDWDRALRAVEGRQSGDSITFFLSPIVDSSLRILRRYNRIDLSYCQNITDDGLKYLGRNSGLTHLKLMNDSQISGQGLENLIGLNRLQSLEIDTVAVSDRGLAAISKMKGLTRLVLDGNSKQISDVGVAHLAKLSKLEHLTINYESITDASLQSISQIRSLRSIELFDNEDVSGVGYASLSELPRLRSLKIGLVDLTDADLKYLEKLSQLKVLELWRCRQLTDAGIAALKSALPDTEVIAFTGIGEVEQ
jgi:Leucine-rich repeat (LRR) protein